MLYAFALAATLALPPVEEFVRGDANKDGQLNTADATAIWDHVFNGIWLTCEDAGDADNNGLIRQADGFYVLAFVYQGGPAPPAPFPDCGEDDGSDSLNCDSPPTYCE
jgi:hypothetical protein